MIVKALASITVFYASIFVLTGSISAQAQLKVCANPAAPCQSRVKEFAPYELSFELPKRLKTNVDYKSAPFFAVILKNKAGDPDTDCDQGEYSSRLERERKQLQARFPDRKVFADHQCPDMGAVSYIIDGKRNTSTLLAIYGGNTREESELVLAKIKSGYRGAVVRRVQVVFERIEQ
jgi:hypothetical protein